MDYKLNAVDSEIPVIVTIDPDNGIYTIRKSDTSGEIFNDPEDLLAWYQENLEPGSFTSSIEYQKAIQWIKANLH
ncbi:hypothetical protein FZC78_04915 [Rossellomorea vietnamensis]|uniref:Uncharacterized protein n=1 Tax=Rossellomorea vietnamensis TaxID=218284 RepID=A0A5D4NZD2_9BACI|nr:hypothetical protein [Rossellomorea vietnamensis]TYS18844.1 hypothetical protein FZC78_04915 [Rossellomorea vietnamensis]